MVQVVGVRFKKAGKIYYFAPNGLPLEVGMNVIVETSRGLEYGEVVIPVKEVAEEQIVQPLKPLVRIATEEDKNNVEANKAKRDEAFRIGLEKIAKHGLPMKLVDVEYTFDNSKIVFYFTADGRVDFRELVKDLASVFRMRIELRQIGVRDEARMIGGLGPCGRCLCCATFLGDFAPVSIKMAKEQSLSLNPTKISGICGRLMCCLRFESELYKDVKPELPSIGDTVEMDIGEGTVVEVDPIDEAMVVGDPDEERVEVSSENLQLEQILEDGDGDVDMADEELGAEGDVDAAPFDGAHEHSEPDSLEKPVSSNQGSGERQHPIAKPKGKNHRSRRRPKGKPKKANGGPEVHHQNENVSSGNRKQEPEQTQD